MPENNPALADAKATPRPLVVKHVLSEQWRNTSGIDPRGFAWGQPGQFIVVADAQTGQQLAEVKINYADGTDGVNRAGDLADRILAILELAYIGGQW